MLSFLVFVWAALPALGFLMGRLLPLPEREGRAPFVMGVLIGALVVSVRGMRVGQLSKSGFEESGALLFIFLLGTSAMRWSVRSSVESGQAASAHVASLALLAAAGAVAAAGGGAAAIPMVVGGLGVGMGTGFLVERDAPAWVGIASSLAVFVAPLMISFARPDRLARMLFALAGGALVAAIASARGQVHPRHWALLATGSLLGAVPWLVAGE